MADGIHHASAKDWRRAAEIVGRMEGVLGAMEQRLVRRGYRRTHDIVAGVGKARMILSLLADDFNDSAGGRRRPTEREADGFIGGDGI